MLKVFRDNLKYLSWVLWAVILVFVLFVFVDFGTVSGGMSGVAGDTVAVVGDRTVSANELRFQYRRIQDEYRARFGDQFTSELAEQFGLRRQALERLVDEKILLDEADRLDLEVGDDEVRDIIVRLPDFQDESGNFVGAEKYAAELQRRGYSSPEQFENAQRERLLLAKLYDVLSESVYVSDNEVEETYRERIETASIRFLQQPAADLASEVSLNQRDLIQYLSENRDDFQLPERRSVAYLLVDNARLRNQIEVADEDVRAYYEANDEEFTQDEQVQARHILLTTNEDRNLEQAKQELEAVRRRIEGGEGFAQVASEVSEDTVSASRGGHLGFFGRGRMTPEFEKAAFESAVGELMGPVETGFGVHLIEVTGRREAGLQPFEDVEMRIRSRLLADQVSEVAEERANALSTQLEGEAETPNAARLQTLAGEDDAYLFQRVGPFGRDDLVPGIGRSAEFAGAVFGLGEGELSAPLRVPRGFALTLVESIEEPRAAKIEDVEVKVRQAAEAERRQQLAMERLGNAAVDISEGAKTFDEAAEELGLTAQAAPQVRSGGNIPGLGRQPALAEAALTSAVGDVKGPFGTTQGAVIFEVTERTEWDAERFADEKDGTRQQLESQRLTQVLTSLIRERKLDSGYYRIVPAWQEQLAPQTPESGDGAVG